MYGSPTFRQLASLLLLVAAGFGLPLLVGNYFIYLGNLLLTYAVLAIGLDILIGRAGQFAFAHTAFFGIGCYATALLNLRFGIPFIVGLPLAALLAAIVAAIVALPSTRMRNVYLALATFAFAEGAQWVFNSWDAVTNGASGLRFPAATIFGLEIRTDGRAFAVGAIILAIVIAGVLSLNTSRLGRAMAAIRESEHAALASGVNVRGVKIVVFALSGAVAGIAGGMVTLHQSFVSPEQFGFGTIVLVISMIAVGGIGTLPGVLIGVLLLGLLPEILQTALRELKVWQEMAYGILLLLTLMFMPGGIWGLVSDRPRKRAR